MQDQDQSPTEGQKQLTMNEFKTIVHNFETTQSTLDDTVNMLDSTLTAKEPKKGRWLLETGDDIDMLDAIASQCPDPNQRPRGHYVWSKMMEDITEKYVKPVIDENTHRELEYKALKVMDQWYIDNQKLYRPSYNSKQSICKKNASLSTNTLSPINEATPNQQNP